jgi:hypothetical protein
MLKIYKPISGLDWMNYRLVKKDLTFHHIEKKEFGGRRDLDNGALLMPVGHQYLHLIECKDIETYITLNKLFKIINTQMAEPNQEQREIVEYLLEEFEYNHRNDKNSKGKTLIQRKYKERW